MKASIADLRSKTTDILKALDRNESVTVVYRGKVRGIIKPARSQVKRNVKEHPFYGMHKEKRETATEELDSLRNSRYDF